ncbi:MAG: hypothetical protein WCI04_02565 [archaeon]
MREKGFSFSFDAIVAVILIAGAIVFVSLNSTNGYEFGSQKIAQKQLADDLLLASIKLGKLQTLNDGIITGFFSTNTPTNYDYLLEIDNYLPNGRFDLNSTYTYGNQTTDINTTSYAESQKIFSIYGNNDINSFNSAKLTLWVR